MGIVRVLSGVFHFGGETCFFDFRRQEGPAVNRVGDQMNYGNISQHHFPQFQKFIYFVKKQLPLQVNSLPIFMN